MRTNNRARRGVALLEAVIALMIFGSVIIALLTLSQQVVLTNSRARHTEAEFTAANALMETTALWPVADLNRHLGTRSEGAFTVNIERTTPALYTIEILSASHRNLLSTVVYRPCCAVQP